MIVRMTSACGGIDWVRFGPHSGTPVVMFPIYDGHGNMVYTLSRGANETFSLGNKRIYGVWGDLRYDGNPNAGPNTQYCANLGHKKDNESGLTYMRARYYEPWTGRFVSQDPAKDGWNWYVYCENKPLSYVDPDGEAALAPIVIVLVMATVSVLAFASGYVTGFLAFTSMLQIDCPWFEPDIMKESVRLGVGAIAALGLAINNLTVYGIKPSTLIRRAGPVALAAFLIGFQVGAIFACLAMMDWEADRL